MKHNEHAQQEQEQEQQQRQPPHSSTAATTQPGADLNPEPPSPALEADVKAAAADKELRCTLCGLTAGHPNQGSQA